MERGFSIMKENMRILGIDPGSHRTGFGIIEIKGGREQHVASGTIILDSEQPVPKRLMSLAQDLQTLIKKYRPHRLALETAFFSKNAKSALVLGQKIGRAHV